MAESERPVTPGETIKGLMQKKYINIRQLASRMDVTQKCASRLVEGKNPLTPYAAGRLEIALGVPAKVWLEAEAAYRARQSELERGIWL